MLLRHEKELYIELNPKVFVKAAVFRDSPSILMTYIHISSSDILLAQCASSVNILIQNVEQMPTNRPSNT